MRKSTRILKRLMALFLVVLMSIESFAAVVSDNDGSAFITKAEFDSLKNNFQSQIDSYNSTIDNKLDAAIASYLAGIKVENTIELESLLNKVNEGSSYTSGWFPMCKNFTFTTTKKPVNGQLALNVVLAYHGAVVYSGWRGDEAYSLNLDDPDDGTMRDTLKFKDIPSTRTDGVYYYYQKNDIGGFNVYDDKYVTCSYKALLAGIKFGWSETEMGANSVVPTWTVPILENNNDAWIGSTVSVYCTFPVFEVYAGRTQISTTVSCLFVSTYEATNTPQVWPIMGSCPTSSNVMLLSNKNISKMVKSDVISTYPQGYKGLAMTNQNGTWRFDNKGRGALSNNFQFYYNYHPYETGSITDLGVKQIANVMNNKKYEFYRGLPICNINENGTVSMELKFHSDSGNKIYFAIRSDTFDNDSTYVNDPSLNIRLSDDSALLSQEVNNNSTLKIKCDVKKGTTLWIKSYDVGDTTKYTGVETMSIKEVIE